VDAIAENPTDRRAPQSTYQPKAARSDAYAIFAAFSTRCGWEMP
jgi:hypothetical protein